MVAVALNPARRKAGYFYVWMAAVCALIAFGGFAPTYWLQLPAGTLARRSFTYTAYCSPPGSYSYCRRQCSPPTGSSTITAPGV
jgi:hypothetical protein